jgi:hypothetical protein
MHSSSTYSFSLLMDFPLLVHSRPVFNAGSGTPSDSPTFFNYITHIKQLIHFKLNG